MVDSDNNVSLLRARSRHAKVTNIELFFDLVFVFAVTQLSHTLLVHLSLQGVVQTGVLFLAVWWVWIFTSWVTNWLDPDRASVRVMLIVLMLAGLVLSSSLPHAFGEQGLVFAITYVAMQVGRSLFVLWALRGAAPGSIRNFQRITSWLVFSGIFWIAGGLESGHSRFILWVIALAIEYSSASLGFWMPGLGRSSTTDWDIDGEHLAERCSLFIIIALGESILVTGATAAELPATLPTLAAFVTDFLSSVAMWWIYFNKGVDRGSLKIAHTADPGRLARSAYTYYHLLIVAGIIVNAVADELILTHPLGHADWRFTAAIMGGTVLFLAGNLMFKTIISGRVPLSHLMGLGLAALLTVGAAFTTMTPLSLGAIATGILIIVAIWETWSLRGTGAAHAPASNG
jgi:low temperature requirement protein LtrA